MDTPAYLNQNFEALSKEMSKLKYLSEEVGTREEPRMAGWLQIVKDKEVEMKEMEEEVKKLEKAFLPNMEAKNKLNKRVIKSLIAVKALIESKDEISKAMETFISEVATWKPAQFSERQLKRFTSNFQTEVGSGGFGVVYKGKLPDGIEVAVKVLRDTGMDNMDKQFMAEVNTMSKTHHRNLAKLYGFCFDPKLKALVYEYVENGSLDKILCGDSTIQWEKLYKIVIGAAKGISYLHESCDEQIIHRDIKASNVLLDSKFFPKVTDFGLAKLYSMNKSQVTLTTGFRGTRSYDAPELRLGTMRKINYRSDVFSFGMMLFEILSRKSCDDENSFAIQVWDKFQKGILEEIMTECGIREKNKEEAKTMCAVALLCIEQMPRDRPTMSQVVNMLGGVTQAWKPLNPFLYHDSSIDRAMSFGSSGSGTGSDGAREEISPTTIESYKPIKQGPGHGHGHGR